MDCDKKCEKMNKVEESFNQLENKSLAYIEAKADYEKSKSIAREQVFQAERKAWNEYQNLHEQADMYGLSMQPTTQQQPCQSCKPQQPQQPQNQCQLITASNGFFAKNKGKLIYFILIVVVLLLATGITPSGKIAETINTQWVETIVDFFKLTLISIALFIGYKGLVGNEKK